MANKTLKLSNLLDRLIIFHYREYDCLKYQVYVNNDRVNHDRMNTDFGLEILYTTISITEV